MDFRKTFKYFWIHNLSYRHLRKKPITYVEGYMRVQYETKNRLVVFWLPIDSEYAIQVDVSKIVPI